MVIQIIGTKKCKDSAKAIRFFKEHRVETQFRDLAIKELSSGELTKISQKIAPQDLINENSSAYQKKGLAYMDYSPLEEIMEDNLLLVTPIIRNGNLVAVGHDEITWKEWVKK